MTKIIIGGRGSGKTTKLLQNANRNNACVVVSNHKRKHVLEEYIRQLDLKNKPPIITIYEYFNSNDIQKDLIRYGNGVEIDDVDALLREIFSGIKINTVTFTKGNIIDLDKNGKEK